MVYEVLNLDDNGNVMERSGFFELETVADDVAAIWRKLGGMNVIVIEQNGEYVPADILMMEGDVHERTLD